MKKQTFLRERGTDGYCPYDTETGELLTGMSYISKVPPENVVGEFWYNEHVGYHELQIELYKGAK
jgi:hypothetical protein